MKIKRKNHHPLQLLAMPSTDTLSNLTHTHTDGEKVRKRNSVAHVLFAERREG